MKNFSDFGVKNWEGEKVREPRDEGEERRSEINCGSGLVVTRGMVTVFDICSRGRSEKRKWEEEVRRGRMYIVENRQ